jgi:hypothetical protein
VLQEIGFVDITAGSKERKGERVYYPMQGVQQMYPKVKSKRKKKKI